MTLRIFVPRGWLPRWLWTPPGDVIGQWFKVNDDEHDEDFCAKSVARDYPTAREVPRQQRERSHR